MGKSSITSSSQTISYFLAWSAFVRRSCFGHYHFVTFFNKDHALSEICKNYIMNEPKTRNLLNYFFFIMLPGFSFSPRVATCLFLLMPWMVSWFPQSFRKSFILACTNRPHPTLPFLLLALTNFLSSLSLSLLAPPPALLSLPPPHPPASPQVCS